MPAPALPHPTQSKGGGATYAERGDEARGRLIDAAIRCFAAKGFHATTTRDISSGARMSAAAMYVHHSSKEELLYVISRSGHDAMLEQMRRDRSSSTDPAEQLRAMTEGFVLEQTRNVPLAKIVNFEVSGLSLEHQAEIADIRRHVSEEIRATVQAGVDAGSFHTDDVRMTALAVSSLGVDVPRWYQPGGERTPEQMAEFYGRLALRVVGHLVRPS